MKKVLGKKLANESGLLVSYACGCLCFAQCACPYPDVNPNPDKPEKFLQFLHVSSTIKKNAGGCVHVTYG